MDGSFFLVYMGFAFAFCLNGKITLNPIEMGENTRFVYFE